MGATQRAYSKVSVGFGLLNLNADLVPVKVPGADKVAELRTVCPSCTDPTKVVQQYTCPANHGPFLPGELTNSKAREIDGTLIRITEEEKEALKDKPKDDGPPPIDLTIVEADTLGKQTRPGDLAYRIRPSKLTPKKTYALLRDLVRDGKFAWVGNLTLRENTRLYRLEVWNGQLVLQSLIRPDDLAPVDEDLDGAYSATELKMATELVKAAAVPFDPAEFRNEKRERAAALDAAKVENPEAPANIPTAKPKDAGDDLLAALEASLKAVAKPKKASKPRGKKAEKVAA